jgi:3-dehydroquinate synthase
MNSVTQSFSETFQVEYTHRVYFTENLFFSDNPLLRATIKEISSAARPKVFMVADATFMDANPDVREQMGVFFEQCQKDIHYLGCLELPGGEQLKNEADYLEQLYQVIDAQKLCRHSCIIALGGGALLDLVGYAAATAHRGIRHLRLPTTTLSQGDGGVGVKNSINYFKKKNFLGTFTPPDAVINDIGFLKSLPEPRLNDGYIEAIKVALIKDSSFFAYLEEKAEAVLARDFTVIRSVIETSARHHIEHIARNGDPFELTSSRPLDFGHWSAHKLEVMSDFELSHGECVAIGIALDSIYSHRKGHLSDESLERILGLISKFGFRLYDERLSTRTPDGDYEILRGLEEFREHLGGKLTIPLLKAIGNQFEVHEMDTSLLAESIEVLRARESTLIT